MATALLLMAGLLVQAPASVRVETAHYALDWEGARAEAEDAGRMLEQGWAELGVFFGAKPDERAKLRVKLLHDEDARLRTAWNDGALVPAQCRFASFSDLTRTAYVARMNSAWATRNALLYAACLQYHSLCKPKNLDITRTWYGAGIAQAFRPSFFMSAMTSRASGSSVGK